MTLLNILNLATAAILIFILSILPGRETRKNVYLILLLSFFVTHLILMQLQIQEVLTVESYAVLAVSMVIWYGPSFYFYIRSFHGLPSRYFIYHLLAPLAGFVAIMGVGQSVFEDTPPWVINSYYMAVLVVYFMKSIRIVLANKQSRGADWMKTYALGFGVLILFYIVESIWMNVDLEAALSASAYTSFVFYSFSLIFTLRVIYQVVTRPNFFSNIKINRSYKHDPKETNPSELRLLLDFVVEQEAYLNPQLTRNEIAENTGLSINRISEIVNSEFKMNLTDWVNGKRIALAEKMLLENQLSIKEIYFDVGFNSKSTFNAAFKKMKGLTPSEFKRQHFA